MVLRNWAAWVGGIGSAVLIGGCTAAPPEEEAVASQEWDLKHGGVDRDGCPRDAHRIVGTPGDDVLWGTKRSDCILGLGGNDEIHGRGGDDVVIGGDGDDLLYGDEAEDKIVGGAGGDTLYGGHGHDLLLGGQGNDVIDGGKGSDWVSGGDCNDHLRGSQGADVLLGESGNDRIEPGNFELVDGGTGVDACRGLRCEVLPDAVACDSDADCRGGKHCVLSVGVCAHEDNDGDCGGGGNEECQDAHCSDANACNGDESCDASGMCVGGSAPSTDDNNPCTVDGCDPSTGVTHIPVPVGASCSDGNACNGAESCDGAGSCRTGMAPIVDDGNPCTADACDPMMGVTHSPLPPGIGCSDGDACNGAEVCDGGGMCLSGAPLESDDGNPCTADSCDPSAGVSNVPVAAGTSCSNGDACDGDETCDGAGSCAAGSPAMVDDNNPCTADACDPVTGVSHTPLVNTPCGGGNICLPSGECGAGECFGRPVGFSCSDRNACNGAELCDGNGVCNPGVPPVRPPPGC
jgi:hypothetical protein